MLGLGRGGATPLGSTLSGALPASHTLDSVLDSGTAAPPPRADSVPLALSQTSKSGLGVSLHSSLAFLPPNTQPEEGWR